MLPPGLALAGESRSFLRAARGYEVGLAVVAIATLLSVAGQPVLETAAFIMVFPLGVMLVTAGFGVGPAVFTAVTGILVFDFVFVPPALAFALPDAKNGLTLVLMVAVASLTSVLAELLRRRVQQARQQIEVEKLRNALLSALSHDLRTPLTALIGASTALCDEGLPPHARVAFTKLIAAEATHLSRLVGSLLELTRLESGRIEHEAAPQAIDEIIAAALAHLESALRGRAVQTSVPEEVPLVRFDPVLIEQVLVNLVENAIRHGCASSPIEVRAYPRDPYLVVEVADRGPGIPPGDEARVFERLYRGRNAAGEGFGLGLTICRAIIVAHRGQITLENRRGGGAIARFTLPIRAFAGDAR